ncbi:MAG: DUF1015 domain-containing protein [Lentisphaeria bacterium]|nr:DUF1015 domain-containing protein [Lentisphaeria bacterium]
MAVFRPFHALMPRPAEVAQVAAVPYDVVNTEEAARLADGNPLTFLRVSRPEIELPEGTPIHSDAVYDKALANFKRLCEAAPLAHDPEANLYVYALTMDGRTQIGIAGTASAAEYDSGVIKKHETTRRDKEDDRARHVMTLRSQTGPVFLTYRAVPAIDSLVREITAGTPFYSFTAADGIKHELWKAGTKSVALARLFADAVPCFYIADGHHRAASAARAAATCRAANPNHTGNEEYNFFLAVAFPSDQLRILPYNRAVKDLNGLTSAEFLAKLAKDFDVAETDTKSPDRSGTFRMLLDGKWYALTPKFPLDGFSVTARLDVSILQDRVLAPILGIDDPRTNARIDFIGGIRGTGELERLCNEGRAAVCFSMYPTTLDQLMDIADAGSIMPPKSTWFEPKLRDGLVSHDF